MRTTRTTRRQFVMAASSGLGASAVLAACAPGATQQAGPGAAGGKPVTLRIGVRAKDAANNAGWADFQEGKRVFEAKYPRITVELTPDMNDQKFLTAAAADDAFDVQDTCCAQIPLEARAGVLMKLDSFIKKNLKPADVKDWIEWQYKFFNIEGHQYGIGKYMGTTVLYYNKDWFRAKGVPFPDQTWDWNTYAEAMVKLSDVPNRKLGAYLLQGADRRQSKVHQNGGHFVDPKDDLKSMLDSPKTIEAFEWIHARMWKDNGAIRRDQLVAKGENQFLNRREHFTGGHVAMMEEGSWGLVPTIQDQPSFDWDVVTLPKGPVQRDVLATTDGWAMWGGTKHVDDAWLLFSWFNGDDWYAIQSKRLQPARLSWMPKWITMITEANPELKGKNLKAFTIGAEQGFARPWELHRYHSATNKLINDTYEKTVNRNEAPIKDTHRELVRQINEIQAQEHKSAGGK